MRASAFCKNKIVWSCRNAHFIQSKHPTRLGGGRAVRDFALLKLAAPIASLVEEELNPSTIPLGLLWLGPHNVAVTDVVIDLYVLARRPRVMSNIQRGNPHFGVAHPAQEHLDQFLTKPREHDKLRNSLKL